MRAIELLMNEHRVIERALTLLELVTTKLRRGEKVPVNALDMLLKFFRTFADKCHHGKEEDVLFPLLEVRGIPKEGGPIGVMLYEHQLGRGYVRAMVDSLESIDMSEEVKTKFISNALNYIALLREHIFKEDNILFRTAENIIDESDNVKILKEFKDVEESRVGHGVHEQLIRSLDIVENMLKK